VLSQYSEKKCKYYVHRQQNRRVWRHGGGTNQRTALLTAADFEANL